MISVPADYSGQSLATVFGYSSPTLAVWDAGTSLYDVTPTSPAESLAVGHAYWVRFPQTTTIANSGTALPTYYPFDYHLQAGWNMIGCPWPGPVAVNQLTVTGPSGVASPFIDAVSSGLVGGSLYTFQAGDSAYEVIDPASGALTPYVGYWLYASQAGTLSFPALAPAVRQETK